MGSRSPSAAAPQLRPIKQDLGKFKQLLAEAGFPNGIDIVVRASASLPPRHTRVHPEAIMPVPLRHPRLRR